MTFQETGHALNGAKAWFTRPLQNAEGHDLWAFHWYICRLTTPFHCHRAFPGRSLRQLQLVLALKVPLSSAQVLCLGSVFFGVGFQPTFVRVAGRPSNLPIPTRVKSRAKTWLCNMPWVSIVIWASWFMKVGPDGEGNSLAVCHESWLLPTCGANSSGHAFFGLILDVVLLRLCTKWFQNQRFWSSTGCVYIISVPHHNEGAQEWRCSRMKVVTHGQAMNVLKKERVKQNQITGTVTNV